MKSRQATGTLRIIGGQWRSRKLQFPAVDQLRPTANRIRETLFNWLQDWTAGEDCLDLFAGSGACGLEALSRGARTVTFVEKNPLAAQAIGENLAALGKPDMPVVCADSLRWLLDNKGGSLFGLVFVDPPYAASLESPSSFALEDSGALKQGALIYMESDRDLGQNPLPDNWRLLKQKKAGAVFYGLFVRERPDHAD